MRPTTTTQPHAGNIVDYLFDTAGEGERDRLPDYADRRRDVGALHARTCQVAHLVATAARRRDRVLFSVRDGLDFVSVFLGVMKAGGISLPLNTFLKAKDYAYYLRDSGRPSPSSIAASLPCSATSCATCRT